MIKKSITILCNQVNEARKIAAIVLIGMVIALILVQGYHFSELRTRAQEAEENLVLAAEAGSVGLWVWRPTGLFKPDEYCWYSDTFIQNLGYDRSEWPNVLGSWSERCHPDDLIFVQNTIAKYWLEQGDDCTVSFRMRKKDGLYTWCQSQSKAMFHEKKPIRMAGQTTMLSEKAVARSKFNLMVDIAPIAIFNVDASGNIVYMNRRAEELFGYPAAELRGKQADIIIAKSQRSAHNHGLLAAAERLSESGPNWEISTACQHGLGLHKDGTEIPVTISNQAIILDDKIEFMAYIVPEGTLRSESRVSITPEQKL